MNLLANCSNSLTKKHDKADCSNNLTKKHDNFAYININ